MKTIRKIKWFERGIQKTDYVRLRIKPDTSIRNYRTEDLVRTFADMFRLPIDRVLTEGFKITGFRIQERASFEIDFSNGQVNFFISIPKSVLPLVEKRLASVWDRATIEQVSNIPSLDPEKTCVHELVYKKHDLYSIHTDSKDNLPLQSLLEAGRLVQGEEIGRVFVYMDPIHQVSWHHELEQAWDKLHAGHAPRKWNSSARNLAMIFFMGVSDVLSEIVGGISEIMSGNKAGSFVMTNGGFVQTPENTYRKQRNDPAALKYSLDRLTLSRTKQSKPGIRTYIWTAVQSHDPVRADLISRTMANAYHDLGADNELVPRKLGGKKQREVIRVMNTQMPPRTNINYSVMSSAEASKLIQMPGLELLEKYPEIERVENAEIQISKVMQDPEGIPLGTAVFKGEDIKVFQPADNDDETCLPNIGIAGMGQGKTKSLIPNWMIAHVKAGNGALAIDPNKKEIAAQLTYAVKTGIIKPEEFYHIDLGVNTFSLDWCEALHDSKARARLAGTAIEFFGMNDENTGQTERFIRAAIMGMKTGRVGEVLQIFQDEKYLIEVIEDMDEGLNKATLAEYKSYSPEMRRKILSPIYNRFNVLLSDPHLAACVASTNSLDFVDILSMHKAVVIDVSSIDLDKTAIDVIVNLISSKIDLAMRLRAKINGQEAEFPFFIMLDEPHQYLRSTKIWEAAVVESRKWRIGYFWTFHYWEQLPNNLQKAIRNAICHFHIGPTSKFTWQNLKEEIYPFTTEEMMKIKSFHMLHIIYANQQYQKPFVSLMPKPPRPDKK